MPRSESSSTERRVERLAEVVKAAGVKLTHQRLEIFKELAGTDAHPDAETLFRAVQKRVPTVSLDTVYRTLWLLHDLGLVTTLGPGGAGVRFDANLDRHHHYVCVACGLVRDFQSDALDALRIPASVKDLGSVEGAQVEVRGLCTRCQKKPPPKTKAKRSLP